MLPPPETKQLRTLQSVMNAVFDGAYLVDQQRIIRGWNEGAFFISGYRRDEVVGRCCADNILQHVDDRGTQLCAQGCPLQKTLQDGQQHQASVFLRHKLGYRVPVSLRVVPIYDDDAKVTGAVEIFRTTSEAKHWKLRIAELEKLVFIDPMTSVPNRRFLECELDRQLQELASSGEPLTTCILDLDNFKEINDRYGHQVGDELLKNICHTLVNCLRTIDTLGRWGGDELLLLLPGTNVEQASTILDRMRLLIAETFVVSKAGFVRTTVSMGAAQASPSDTRSTLLQRADAQLYRAKGRGRNRCCVL
jgi:diguanylate cyclase (GGDEF)-like protein/PAS domain S-box-containing protein